MAKKRITTTGILLVGLMLAGPASAAEETKNGEEKKLQKMQQQKATEQEDGAKQAQTRMKTGLVSANRLIGQNVENPQGELLGEISNIIIDQKNNHAAYVEVTFGGILGIGEAERAVPFGALEVTESGFVLDLSKDRLSQLPQREPGMTEEDFGRQIYRFFGRAPYWEKYGPAEHPGLKTPRKE